MLVDVQRCLQAAPAQHGVVAAQLDQLRELGQQGGVGPPAQVGPGVGGAVVGVFATGDADLVAVVHGRRAGVAHLEEHGQQQALLGQGDGGRVFGVVVPAQRVQRARLVVAGQQVHQRKQRLRRVGLAQMLEVAVERTGLAAGRVVQHGAAKDIVHGAVEHVAQEVLAGVEPRLGHGQCVGAVGLDGAAPFAPEVVGHPGCHVHAPAGRTAVEPQLHHRVLVAVEEVAQGRIALVEFGQVGHVHPALELLVGVGLCGVEAVPAGPGRRGVDLAALEGALRAEIAVTVEIQRVGTGVVQAGVGDDAHAALGGFARQPREVGVAAEAGVDVEVVRGVVLVVAAGLEHRGHIDGVGAQALDVVELVRDAGQVAAEEVVVEVGVAAVCFPVHAVRAVGALVPVGVLFHRVLVVARDAGLGVVARVAVAKAVGEDEVVDDVCRPAGHLEAGVEHGLAKAADAAGGCGRVGHSGQATGAFFARPEHRGSVVLQHVGLAADQRFKPVAVHRHVGVVVAGAEALARTINRTLHGQAREFGVVQHLLVALQAPLLDHQRQPLDAGQRGDGVGDARAGRHRAKRRLVRERARVEAQAQRHRVGDGLGAGVGEGLGPHAQARLVALEGQAHGVFAVEAVREVAVAFAKRAGGLPAGIGHLEFVAAAQLDVEVVSITAVLEQEVVLRGPVAGRATQEELCVAQRRGRGAGLHLQLRCVGQQGDGEALLAVEAALDLGAAAQQRGACALAEVGVGAPGFVGHLEAVLALQPRDQFPAVAGPGELLRLVGVPAVEGATQVERAATQRVGGAVGRGPGRCTAQPCQCQRGPGSALHAPTPVTP